LSKEDAGLLQQAEKEIIALYLPTDDKRIKQSLDNFYWERLPATEIGRAI